MKYEQKVSLIRKALLSALTLATGILSLNAGAQTLSTVSGRILPDYVIAANPYPPYALTDADFDFTFDFCATDRPLHIIKLHVKPDLHGAYSFNDIPRGAYNVYLKGMIWLRGVQKNVTITADSVTLDFINAPVVPTIVNPGDCDHDNYCGPTDLNPLVSAYGSDYNMPGTGYDPAADFNFDGLVGPTDYSYFVTAYNTAGETFATNLMLTQQNLQPMLTWESVSNIEGAYKFRIYRATTPNSTSPTQIAQDYPYTLGLSLAT